MKLFTGGVLTETNTFAPFPAGMATFREMLFLRAGEGVDEPLAQDPCRTFIERGRDAGWEVVAGLRTFAQPSGIVVQAVYEELRDEMLDDLRRALPVDAVFLSLHGAMVAADEPDGEGDIIEHVRRIVGPDVPIGVHIDPHCHLTARMVDNADIIRIWKEYPHTDIAERASEVFDWITARLNGAPRPVPVLRKCGMAQLIHTTREPMRSFVDRCTELEGKDGIHSISIAHSFPWGDVPDMGTRMLVYADSNDSLPAAERLAEDLSKELWGLREAIATPWLTIDESLDRAYEVSGPVVISDGPDNPGGGAPSDSTWFLARLLERNDPDWAIGYLFDPQVVRIAQEAGLGAQLRLRVGGKSCRLSGQPVDLVARVSGIRENVIQRFGSMRMYSGDAVALDLGRNRHLVVNSVRNQAFDPAVFAHLDVDLSGKQAIVVKSSQHFYDLFAPLAAEVLYAAAPGVVTPDLASLNYQHADRSQWPLSSTQSPE